jgi:RNA polymerase sigma-70 factor (ECF subfamily)
VEALAERVLAGDEAAWNELVRRFERRVWVSLLALGAPPDVARDLSQDTWVRLWAKAKAGELTELKLPGLAVTQARFLWLSARRAEAASGAVLPSVEVADASPDPEKQAARTQEVARAVAAVEALPDRARSVFTAVYDEGLSAAEASSRFGISVQRVRQTLFEVRGRLRAVLGGA